MKSDKFNQNEIESVNNQPSFVNEMYSKIKERALQKMNLAKNDYDSLFNIGASKFKSGDFYGASTIFQVLVVLDENNITYLKSLASSLQNDKSYLLAVYYYKMAYNIKPTEELDCLFYMANCYIELDKHHEALECLNKFEEKSSMDNMLKARSTLLKKLLQNKKTNT